jgi:hypothetical protein
MENTNLNECQQEVELLGKNPSSSHTAEGKKTFALSNFVFYNFKIIKVLPNKKT